MIAILGVVSCLGAAPAGWSVSTQQGIETAVPPDAPAGETVVLETWPAERAADAHEWIASTWPALVKPYADVEAEPVTTQKSGEGADIVMAVGSMADGSGGFVYVLLTAIGDGREVQPLLFVTGSSESYARFCSAVARLAGAWRLGATAPAPAGAFAARPHVFHASSQTLVEAPRAAAEAPSPPQAASAKPTVAGPHHGTSAPAGWSVSTQRGIETAVPPDAPAGETVVLETWPAEGAADVHEWFASAWRALMKPYSGVQAEPVTTQKSGEGADIVMAAGSMADGRGGFVYVLLTAIGDGREVQPLLFATGSSESYARFSSAVARLAGAWTLGATAPAPAGAFAARPHVFYASSKTLVEAPRAAAEVPSPPRAASAKPSVGGLDHGTATPALETVAAAERDARATARLGIRPELKTSADAMFAEIDQVTDLASRTPRAGLMPVVAMLNTLLDPAVNVPAMNRRSTERVGSVEVSHITSLSQTGSTLVAGITWQTDYAKDGLSLTELTTVNVELQLCPDASGHVPFTYNVHFDSRIPGHGGEQIDLTGTSSGSVGDGADLQSWSSDTSLSYAAQGSTLPVTGSDARLHVNRTYDWATKQPTAQDFTVVRDTIVPSVYAELRKVQNNFAEGLEHYLLERARERWRTGACVEIVIQGADDSNTVAPSSTKTFTGVVRHKLTGVELPLPIVASLSGGQSIAPTAPSTSPVTYRYSAPDKESVLSTVSLETRSRWGVSKKSLTFFTRSLKAYGGTIGFDCTYRFVRTSSTTHIAGSLTVTFTRPEDLGGGYIFKFTPDPANWAATLSTFTSTDDHESCSLATGGRGQSMPLLALHGAGGPMGQFVIRTTTPPQYSFVVSAELLWGTERCVEKEAKKPRVTTRPCFHPFHAFTSRGAFTSSGPPDPGWVMVADPTLLSGAAHTVLRQEGESVHDCTTTWTLHPQ